MSIRLCVGEYARVGYEPEHIGVKVYSLEELCFFIKENAFLLDDGFMEDSLAGWLCEECKLQELGEELRTSARKKITLKSYVAIILEYACFFSKEMNQEILGIIVENSNHSIYEKKKARADALVNKGHYAMAGKEYGRLLQMLPEEQIVLKGEIYHGCGVCLAKMFYFTLAGEYFLKAHTLTGKIASYKQYLWTKRLSVSEQEYVEFLREHQEAYEDSVEMEEYLEELNSQWKDSHNGVLLKSIQKEKEMRRLAGYQEKLTQRAEYLKDAYRQMLS
ncbi:MAG: hypothetical protein IKW30_03000 [Lachnospiraceae bacterium]|nr:hypothetical protein [Lachnospiraceae bacterium]